MVEKIVGVEDAIKLYLDARRMFLDVAKQSPDELDGNDNIIGRIGEYLALIYLRSLGRSPVKVESRSQKGYDLVEGEEKISVKLLTSENSRGRGVRLSEPWTEFILIYLDTGSLGYQIGHLTKQQFSQARAKAPRLSDKPIVKKTMLGEKGLVGKYGRVLHSSFSSQAQQDR